MIKSLHLKNIALIENAEIEFERGLNVLSGETGSGKSVIIDSINFVLGAKADKSMIRFGENECLTSAVFDISDLTEVKKVLADLDIEDSDELIVTRKLSQDSKSSLKVNGIPFTLSMLKSVTSLLVDVHGQSEHYLLLKESEQLGVLDKFAGDALSLLKGQCSELCDKLKAADEKFKSFGGNESDRAIRADILKFQIEEIESAEIREGEENELVAQKKKIQSAEKLSEAFAVVQGALSGENCAIDYINSAIRGLSPITSLDDEYLALYDRLKSVAEELNDVSSTAESMAEDIDVDEETADKIEERLDKIKTLKRKYGADEKAVLDFLDKARAEYSRLIDFDAEYEKLTAEKQSLLDKLNGLYVKMSEIRRKAAKKLISGITAQLRELGMKDARFDVEFGDLKQATDKQYGANGGDSITFLFSANLGEPVKPMSKIISGGEMSRFMLALKTVISSYHGISTYIFDEIDAGISGKTAEIVAEKFAEISKNIQVIAISHLPQIISFADTSFKISKRSDGEKTFTLIEKLDEKSKTEEVVRLIGGDMSSVPAVSHAREMITKADNFKKNLNPDS